MTEATLPIEQRGLQRRYTLIESFDRFLPPTGQVILLGPDPAKLPQNATGLHLILLRIEATDDREGDSFTGVGTVNSGGVVGFPLPVLRYYVSSRAATTVPQTLMLLQPDHKAELALAQPMIFRWRGVSNANAYKLEIRELNSEVLILSAVLNQETTRYTAPPWLQNSAGKPLQWRVVALSDTGTAIVQSPWRDFKLPPCHEN